MFPWMQANHLMNLGNLSQLLKTGFNMYHLMNISDVFQVRFGLHVTLGGFPMKAGLVERDERAKRKASQQNSSRYPLKRRGMNQ